MVILKVRGPERHDEVPKTNKRTIMVSKQADNYMTVKNHPETNLSDKSSVKVNRPCNLLPADKALVNIPVRTPVEDAGGVILVNYLVLLGVEAKVNQL